MVSYDKAIKMVENAKKKFFEGKLTSSDFKMSVKKAGYGDMKAEEFLKKAEAEKVQYVHDKEEENKAKEAHKAEIKAQSAKAAEMKKENDGVPTVDQVFAKPERGQAILGNPNHKKSGTDKKEILTVDSVLKDYDEDKAILGSKLKEKKTSSKPTTSKTATNSKKKTPEFKFVDRFTEELRRKYIKTLSEDKAEVPTVDDVMANYDEDKATLGRDINGNKLAPTPKERAASKRKALAAKKKAEKESAVDKSIDEIKEDLMFRYFN